MLEERGVLTIVEDEWAPKKITVEQADSPTSTTPTTTTKSKNKITKSKDSETVGYVILYQNGKYEEVNKMDGAIKKLKDDSVRFGEFNEIEPNLDYKRK